MKYQCNVIHDLMLPCAEGSASAEGRAALRTHLSECKDCAKEWKKLTGSKKVSEKAVRIRIPKKVKKGIITGILAAVLIYFAAVIIVPYVKMYAQCGNTPEEAIEKAVQKNSWITGPYNPDNILGSADFSKDNIFYWMLNDIGCGTYFISTFHGKYYCGGGTSHGIPENEPVCEVFHTNVMHEQDEQEVYAYYAQDAAVKSISMTIDGQAATASCNEKGLCVLIFQPVKNPEKPNWKSKEQEITGEALDADGNVLYTLAPPDWEHNINRYRWIGSNDSQ